MISILIKDQKLVVAETDTVIDLKDKRIEVQDNWTTQVIDNISEDDCLAMCVHYFKILD